MPTNLINVATYQGQLRNKTAAKDWCFNECLANDPRYSKPDSQKEFILWEAKGTGIEISFIPNIQVDHPQIWSTFVVDFLTKHVRFPFNNFDVSDPGTNLSWFTAGFLEDELRMKCMITADAGLYSIPRWSTASRSCLAFIPERIADFSILPAQVVASQDRVLDRSDGDDPFQKSEVAQQEWAARNDARFYTTVGKSLGSFCRKAGAKLGAHKGRLYSLKTGVTHVGSKNQVAAGKHKLESNSAMAMLRSQVVRQIEAARKETHADPTCRTQVEILTITAPCKANEVVIRDGFQIRDITGMRNGETYLPAHAIPYSDNAFYKSVDHGGGFKLDDDLEFWTNNFSIPCGRAKARMLLEFGLIHSSANAQNFIMAFEEYGEACAFILRDIGDTYWHQSLIKNIYGADHPSYNAFLAESATDIKHTLHTTSSDDYPAPHMSRLASYSVITHAFADKMIEKRGWTHAAVLSFTQGIIDGFTSYITEAFAACPTPFTPRGADWRTITDGEILQLGRKMAYPTKPFYDASDADKVIARQPTSAAYVRTRSQGILALQAEKLTAIQQLLNAEEVLICAQLDAYVMSFLQGKLGRTIRLPKVVPPID